MLLELPGQRRFLDLAIERLLELHGSTIDVGRVRRTVEELDHVRAEQIDYAAKKTMSLHGDNAIVTANELVKVDGEQIHVG